MDYYKYAEGGDVSLMAPPMEEPMMEEQMPMEEAPMSVVDDIMSMLPPEDQEIFSMALNDYPELMGILETASATMGGEFDGEGPVTGPGTETSDSIPAKLSDGEFVFTAKAVKQLGVDKLRKMMAKAEQDYDAALASQEAAQMEGMEGFAGGGLLEGERKKWGNADATSEYYGKNIANRRLNVNGAGNQLPTSRVGIMGRQEIDTNRQARENINRRAMAERNPEAMMTRNRPVTGGTTPSPEVMNERIQPAVMPREQAQVMGQPEEKPLMLP